MGCGNAGFAVGRGVAPVRTGFIPPAGVCAAAGCGGMRASRPTAAPRLVSPRFDRAAGVCMAAHNVRPYMGCGNAGFAVGRGVSRSVGAGFIPPAGVCAAAGCGGMRASRPTIVGLTVRSPGFVGHDLPRGLPHTPLHGLRHGFAVGRGVARAHNVRPYMGCGGAGFAVGRGVARAHNVRPYMGCGGAGFAVGRGVAPVRRGGFHIRPGRRRAAGSGACRGLQPPSAAVVPQFSIKALRFPGWRFWRAVRPAIRRWGFRRIFRSIRPQGSGAAFPAGSCACRRSW